MRREDVPRYLFFIVLAAMLIIFVWSASNTRMLGEDENLYLWFAKQIHSGIFPLYRNGTPFIQPPLVPLIVSLIPEMWFAKVVVSVFGILTAVVLYYMGKQINEYVGIMAGCLIFLPAYFSHFSMILYTEIPIAFFSALALYAISKTENLKTAVVAGVIMGLSFYVKFSGLVLIFGALIYALVDKKNRKYLAVAVAVALAIVAVHSVKNMLLYGHPYTYGLEIFMPVPETTFAWIKDVALTASFNTNLMDLFSVFNFFLVFAFIEAVLYFYMCYERIEEKERNMLVYSFINIALFFVLFVFLSGERGVDPRYFTIIFPFVVFSGACFLNALMKWKRSSAIFVIALLIASLYVGATGALNTSASVRYSESYVTALELIKTGSPESTKIFTLMCGSAEYYSERDCIWTIEDFPELMRTDNVTRMNEILRGEGVGLVVLSRNYLAEDIVVPGSNFIGMPTNNFFYKIVNAPDYFTPLYGDGETFIVAVK